MTSAPAGYVLITAVFTAGALGCSSAGPAPSTEPAPATDAHYSITDDGTGSVSVVDGDDLQGRPAVNFLELLEGRVAGVQVVRNAGGGVSFRIRGPTTFYGSNEPLYVVDGMPVVVVPGRGLEWLNPSDIARIEILKDASTTSMYGVRGANGVVLITTRRGKR